MPARKPSPPPMPAPAAKRAAKRLADLASTPLPKQPAKKGTRK